MFNRTKERGVIRIIYFEGETRVPFTIYISINV